MAESDGGTTIEALRHLDDNAAAAWLLQSALQNEETENATPEATITKASLTNLWREMSETPELVEALNIFGDPQIFKSCFEITYLSRKERAGGFPNSRTATIETLCKASYLFFKIIYRSGNGSLDPAILSLQKAVLLSSENDEQLPGRLHELGLMFLRRAEIVDAPKDIDQAITCVTRAVEFSGVANEPRMAMLRTLGKAYVDRFIQSQATHDIDSAIEYQKQVVSLVEGKIKTDDPVFFDLGRSYALRFESSGALEDIDEVIRCQTLGLDVTPQDHVERPGMLDELGNSFQERFTLLGTLEDIRKAIDLQSQAVSLTPDGHKDRPGRLNDLGNSYQSRFEQLGKLADIDQAIAHQSEAVSLTLDGHADRPGWLNDLGISYQRRFERFGELADIERAISCNSDAVSLTSAGDLDKPGRLNNLGNSYQCRFERLGELSDIESAIACQSEAISLTPDGDPGKLGRLNNLGNSYQSRFDRLGELRDIDQAIACLSDAMSLTPDGHADKPALLNNLDNSYQCRFECLRELEDINRAIACQTNAVSLTPDGHVDKPGRLSNLGNSHEYRFERLGEIPDIDQAIACKSKAASLTPDGYAEKPTLLNNLGISHRFRFGRLGELTDIDRAIKCQSMALSLTPDGHEDRPRWLNNLGVSYQSRFERLGELADINQAIAYKSEVVSLTPDGHAGKPGRLSGLGISYQSRFDHFSEPADLEHAISCFQMASQSPVGNSFVRFRASRQWATLAAISNHPTTLPAYSQTMELVPKVIWIGSTITARYDYLHPIGAVSVEAAAYAISAQRYELALEWLEAGRSVVWSQTLQLRTSSDELSASAPALAESLAQVAQDLETAGQRETRVTAADSQAMEAIAQNHRRLAGDYEQMLAEARKLPGFQDFMRSKTAKDLMNAARSGPIVVINVHSTRCDALILRPHCADIEHVPLPHLSVGDVANLQRQVHQLLTSGGVRRRGYIRTKRPMVQFKTILATLWHKIVKPVLASLGCIEMPCREPLPHVTWCTTGALAFLPLHAAGCYDGAGPKIFDFVVSSYSPTLSALLAGGSGSLEVGGILTVGQEATPGCAPLAGIKDELDHIQRHAKEFPLKQIQNDQATVDAVLSAMEKYDSVHLACHGSQVLTPTDSCFHLHDGPLTLAKLTKKSFKNKGLAFLSACETATGSEEMPDEAVYLAAGMLVAGYRTVIATMWSINDADAPLIADLVYGQLMKDGKLGDARAARALHAAVKALRDKIGEEKFTRWVPYIHVGA